MSKKIIYSISLFFILATCYLILNTRFAQAQSEIPLSLANAHNEVTLDPGETQKVTMRLFNRGEMPITGSLGVLDFVVNDDKGTPIFLEGDNKMISNKYSAASWISFPYEKLAIAPNDKITFDVTINVPLDAAPGGHYAAVLFQTGGETETLIPSQDLTKTQSAVSITARIVGLFSITVAGPVKEQALLTKLIVPSFSEYGPVNVVSEINNLGDTHIKPVGFVSVSDWFGRLISQAKLEEVNIFPNTVRSYENTVGEHLMIGRYKLALAASYGKEGKVVEGFAYFWVIPWKMIAVIALALAIIILLFTNWRKNTLLRQKSLEKKLAEEEKELDELKEELKNKS